MAKAAAMEIEDNWHAARLLTTVGIKTEDEQERRATSHLLAVMFAVPEFGRLLLHEVGAPGGAIRTFTEIHLKDTSGKTLIPDGAVVVSYGKSRWRALVEVKTGKVGLREDQVAAYVHMARDLNLDAVITVSNEITRNSSECPIHLKPMPKKVQLRHLSWSRILTHAIVQLRKHQVTDKDQAWLLGELIDYLEHPKSGAGAFQDMGDKWVHVREAVRAGTAHPADPEVRAVCERWEQFVDYLALVLSQDLLRSVAVIRKGNPNWQQHLQAAQQTLAKTGVLTGTFRVPDAIAPFTISADLRTRQVTTTVEVQPPQKPMPATRIKWLVHQLDKASGDVRLEARFANSSDFRSALLDAVRTKPSVLFYGNDPKKPAKSLSVAITRPLGLKRGSTKGTFVGDTRTQVTDFYRDVVQGLKKWQPPAPQLVKEAEEEKVVAKDAEVGADGDAALPIADLIVEPAVLALDPSEPLIAE